MRPTLAFAVALCCGASLLAQVFQGVAPDRIVVTGFGIPLGVAIVDPVSGVATPVTTPNISYGGTLEACAVDPLTGNIRASTTGNFLIGVLAGGSISLWTGGTGLGTSLLFDRNGDTIRAGGLQIYRGPYDPPTPATAILAAPAPTPCNALAYDAATGTLYAGLAVNGEVYLVNGNGTLTLVGTTGATGSTSAVTGLALSADGTLLFASTASSTLPLVLFSVGPNQSYPVVPAVIPTVLPPLNDIEMNRNTGVLYAISATVPGSLWAIDSATFLATQLNPALSGQGGASGMPTGVAVQDLDGRLTVFPSRPRENTIVTFRAALGGRPSANPLDFGIFALVAANNVPLSPLVILAQAPFTTVGLRAMTPITGVSIPPGSAGFSFDLLGAEFSNGGVWEGTVATARIEVVP